GDRGQMANRDRERIGGAVRRRRGTESEQQLHHVSHLLLLRTPVADDRALDLRRRVLDDLASGLDRREHGHTARVTELERAAHVGRMKQILDGHAIRSMRDEQRRQFSVDAGEAMREAVARRRGNRAAGHEMMAASIRLHAAVAGALGAGIDAEDSHAREASISFSSMSQLAQTCWTSSCSSMTSISLSICCASLPVSLT